MCSSTGRPTAPIGAQGVAPTTGQLLSQDCGFISTEVVDNVVFGGMGQFKPGTPQFHQASGPLQKKAEQRLLVVTPVGG